MKTTIVALVVIGFMLFVVCDANASPDVNKDGEVNWIDWMVVSGAAIFEKSIPGADVNLDGWVDHLDLLLIQENPDFDLEEELIVEKDALSFFFRTGLFPGDINEDGVCNLLDIILVSIKFGATGEGIKEDVNDDGNVDIKDISEVAKYKGTIYFIPQETPLLQQDAVKTLVFLREENNEVLQGLLPLPQAQVVVPKNKLSTTWGALKK